MQSNDHRSWEFRVGEHVKMRAREDQFIIGYLLGTASEWEQSQIETRYFREPHFYEAILAHEEELVCDYINNLLTPSERQQFEKHFLTTPRRQRKLESTFKLMTFIADQGMNRILLVPEPAKLGFIAISVRWANNFVMPRLNFLWTLASISILAFGVWMLSVQVFGYRQKIEQQEARQANSKKPNAKLLPRTEKKQLEANRHSNLLIGVADQLQASLDDPPALLAIKTIKDEANTFDITLAPSRLRSEVSSKFVNISVNTQTLRLHLKLNLATPVHFSSFNAVVKTLDGQEIIRRQNLGSHIEKSNKSLIFQLPANRLDTGKYIVLLTGIKAGKEIKPAVEFFFSIKRD